MQTPRVTGPPEEKSMYWGLMEALDSIELSQWLTWWIDLTQGQLPLS